MVNTEFSDTELMAYADGELKQERALELDLALSTDEDLAGRLALFTDTRTNISDAFAPMLDEPVPEALMQSIQKMADASDAAQAGGQSNVVSLSPKVPAPGRPSLWQMSIAASLALVVGVGTGFYFATQQLGDGLRITQFNDHNIINALSQTPSGQRHTLPSGSQLTMIATFIDGGGAVCREFEYAQPDRATLVAVTCFDQKWDVKFAVAAGFSSDTGFAPASSLETLDAYLQATNAQAPLSLEDEQKALAGLGLN